MKTISNQEVIKHLKQLNRWWLTPGSIDPEATKLKPRAYLGAVLGLVTNEKLRRAVVLLGPRRVGKTVLIHHLIRDLLRSSVNPARIGYVEVDHPLLHGQSMESLTKLMIEASGDQSDGIRYLFFDEIQYLKDWDVT